MRYAALPTTCHSHTLAQLRRLDAQWILLEALPSCKSYAGSHEGLGSTRAADACWLCLPLSVKRASRYAAEALILLSDSLINIRLAAMRAYA